MTPHPHPHPHPHESHDSHDASGSNPLARSRSRTRLTRVAALSVLALSLAWAFWPLRGHTLATPKAVERSDQPVQIATTPLNLNAFDAGLWIVPKAPPAPTVAAAPPPPLTPLKLQLLGIVTDRSGPQPVLRAALYDPDSDRIVMVADGDSISGRTVRKVDAAGITLALGNATQSLLLRTDAGGKSP